MAHFSGLIKPKLPHVGTTIFAVMTKLAVEWDAINLSQGFPDFSVSPKLIHLVAHNMRKGHNQYAPMQGILALREAICRKIETLYSAKYHPEKEINITAGATQALYTAISAVVHQGDEVILFSPAYDCYAPAIELNGGKPVYSQLKLPSYSVDWDEVQRLMNSRTRMIVINSPHNPTGSIFSQKDMLRLSELVKDTDTIILSDEVYEHIIFDNKQHQSLMRFPDLIERSFVVFSFGKAFHNTGWKMGYCLAPENLMNEFRSVHQFLVYSCNTPVQYALADFLGDKDNYSGIGQLYQQKRDLFLNLIKESRFQSIHSSGSYFQLLDYSKITDEKDVDFAVRMTKEYRVASIPVSVFYPDPVDNKVLRFCFAKREETLERAAAILCRI